MNAPRVWLIRSARKHGEYAAALRLTASSLRIASYGAVLGVALVMSPFCREAWATIGPPTPRLSVDMGGTSAELGSWSGAESVAPVPTAISIWLSTVSEMADSLVDYPCQCHGSQYDFTVRMINHSSGADTRVGLVYDYQDINNYSEIVFSPTRTAEARRISGGAMTVLASNTYAEGGQNRHFDVVLVRRGDSISVAVNGSFVIRNVPRAGPGEKLGLVTHNTTGNFLFGPVDVLTGNEPFREDFQDGLADGWPYVDTNNWMITNGVLKNFTVRQANAASAPVYNDPYTTSGATMRAKLRSPYGASGNLVGLTWGDGSREVVFSRTGVARINRIDFDGSITPIATATIPTLTSDWFEVVLYAGVQGNSMPGEYGGVGVDVTLNGNTVFRNADHTDNYFGFPWGHFGLVTHWSPGEFDLVEAGGPFPLPYSQAFNTAPAEAQVVSGSWTASGGTYNSTGSAATAIATLTGSPTFTFAPFASVDFSYRARLLNTSPAGSVGLITHYDEVRGQYYEVLFTPAGQIIVNKHVQGTVVRQATGSYTVTPNTWFDAELRSINNKTTIYVNGAARLNGILQGQLREGRTGLVTHAALGKFDNVSWREIK